MNALGVQKNTFSINKGTKNYEKKHMGNNPGPFPDSFWIALFFRRMRQRR
jgi:hypothetical protein